MKKWRNEVNVDLPLASRNLDSDSMNTNQIKEFQVQPSKQESCKLNGDKYYVKKRSSILIQREWMLVLGFFVFLTSELENNKNSKKHVAFLP